jgi:hypothetical protein
MHERRSFGIAFSTTLFGVGFGAFLAYYIAMAALPSEYRGRYGWVPILALAGIGAAVVAGIAVLVSLQRAKERRLALGRLTDEARALAERVSVAVPSEVQAVTDDLDDWQAKLDTWFETEAPEFQHHFFNPSGTLLRFTGNNPQERLLFVLDLRLQRVAEVTMKL